MRISIIFGLFTLALGIFLSYLADAMITLRTTTALQTTASIIATVIFILFSASMLGLGIGLVIHWILGFTSNLKAFILKIILSFATLFVGIGAAIMSNNIWTGFQVLFTFLFASIFIFGLSSISLARGLFDNILSFNKYIKKYLKRGKK